MAIFRGPGGAGDATGDATNAAALAIQKANEASASATSAASSATAAASSATDASDSADTASTAASTATTKASQASTSATNAATSATAAQTAETNASNSASAASTSATNASSSASSASTSASTATTQATNAASSASSAATSASEAAASAASISNRVISVTDNTNAALRITQLGTGNALLVEDSTNPDSTPFVIDANGNVIQGTTASTAGGLTGQAYQQHVVAAISGAGALFAGWNATQPNAINIARSTSGTVGSFTPSASGTANHIRFLFDDGTQFIRGAEISAIVDGTPGTNDMPGRLVFSTTADGASSPTEAVRINSAQSVSIGTSAAAAGTTLRLSKSLTGGTSAYGVLMNGAIQSDVTSQSNSFTSQPSTAAAAFTLTSLRHYLATQSTIGAGSTVTNQYGFSAASTLTGATNNYGFYSDIASGTGRWNFYAAGTANNYFAGNVGVGVTSPGYKVDVSGDVNITGNFYKNGTVFSGGAKGGGSDAVFYENDQTVTTSYTIGTNKSAMSTGPISISSGVSVTVPSGSRWVIL